MPEDTDDEKKTAAHTTEWCAGLPLVSQRPMDEAELRGLRREALRLRRTGIGTAAFFPVSISVLALLYAVAPFTRAFVEGAGILLLLSAPLTLPLCVLLARDCLLRSKGLRGDLKLGVIKKFEGPLATNQTADETLERLRRAKLAPKTGAAWYGMEILPVSGRVWRVTGASVRGWVIAQTVEVAQTPEFAGIAAQWLQPYSRKEDATLLGGQRELSPAEQMELRRFARRLWLRPLPAAAGLTAWAALPVTAWILHRRLDSGFRFGQELFLVCIALLTDYHFVRSVLLSRRLARDAQRGRVMILSEQADLEKEKPPQPIPPTAEKAKIVELLPVSRMIWTGDGRPAAWRVLKP